MKRLPHVKWVGYFKAISDRYGDNPDAPQNWTEVETPAERARSRVPTVCSVDAGTDGRTVALFVEAGDLVTLEQHAQMAGRLMGPARVPVLGICDGFLPTGNIAWCDWLGLECYAAHPDETPGDIWTRVHEALGHVTSPVVLIGQAYDRRATVDGPAWYHGDLMACQEIVVGLARVWTHVIGILWFSDGRPGGTRDHEELRPFHREVLCAVQGCCVMHWFGVGGHGSDRRAPADRVATDLMDSGKQRSRTMSRQMLVGWITLIIAVLALPQLAALIPPGALPWVACVAGALTLLLRWLAGGLGVNTLTAAGLLTLGTGLLSVPELLAVIPVAWMPIVTMITAVVTLLSRYLVGQSLSDPAPAVNALFRTGRGY